ncbi:arrestin [Cordyceps militaris CM01]|uniref:Arrestin n=1 Tax=Cordyceps militaris (strain CM01) TaxID=983644 RepID=G3JC84_CORMM|nr:arrestin [Cordyceps militaris CM01]EGX93749.1 arrestin [Cordyceps militaris CM01]
MPTGKIRAVLAGPKIRSRSLRATSHGSATTCDSSHHHHHHHRARIEIRITNHYAAKTYTTHAPITGVAVLSVPRDTPFDRIAIQLAGFAATRNYMTPEIDQVLHHFLLLDMPPPPPGTALPPRDHVLRAGQTYALPFHFVVPERLPIGSCGHRCEHASVREHHLRLPPTTGAWGDRDDGSPETARVQYCVSVAVLQQSAYVGEEPVCVLRGHHEVRVLPVYPEDAPLDIEHGAGQKWPEYKLAASKTLRKSLVARKLGVLSVEAAQPSVVLLSSDARQASSARIALTLRFTPARSVQGAADEEASLPTVHSISAKLVAKTFYNTSHMGAFPDRPCRHELNFGASMHYSDSRRTADVPFTWAAGGWQRHHKQVDQPTAWAATVEAAFQLPADHKRILLPSFHSCLLSRIYILRLALSLGPGHGSVTLSLPLQVIVQGDLSVPRHLVGPERGDVGVALPSYMDHLFLQNRFDDEMNTHMPLAVGIII